jgi:hypothetical protein
MVLKKIGYYIVKGKCLKVYEIKKINRRSKRMVTKKVNYKGKVIKKGTKIYKTKTDCKKALNKKRNKKSNYRSKSRSRSKFGQPESPCYYSLPYFGNSVPSIAKTFSGTMNTGYSGSSWKWPAPPGAKQYDVQQGSWGKM